MSAKEIRAGKAFVEVTIRDKLAQGLRSAWAKLKAFGAMVKATFSMVAGTFTSIAGGIAAVIGPMVALAKRFADVGSELHDMSGRTGVAVETLSAMRFAAEQTGATLADVEAGLRKMAKAGLSVKDFDKVAASINAIEDPSKRAAEAMKIFGKSGTKLLPMLAEWNALRAQAQGLGLIISTEDAKKADDLGDKFQILKDTFGAFLVKAGSALSGPISTGLEVLIKLTVALSKVLDNVTAAIDIGTAAWERHQSVAIATLSSIVDALAAGDLISAWGIVTTGMESMWLGTIRMIKDAFWGMVQFVVQGVQRFISSIADVLQEAERLSGLNLGSGQLRSAADIAGTGIGVAAAADKGKTNAALTAAMAELVKLRSKVPNLPLTLGAQAAAASEGASGVGRGGSSAGSFSAAAAGLLGRAGGPIERTAKATEKGNSLLTELMGKVDGVKDAVEDIDELAFD